jgi:hypothetical protein
MSLAKVAWAVVKAVNEYRRSMNEEQTVKIDGLRIAVEELRTDFDKHDIDFEAHPGPDEDLAEKIRKLEARVDDLDFWKADKNHSHKIITEEFPE